jgi:hypothetical protein
MSIDMIIVFASISITNTPIDFHFLFIWNKNEQVKKEIEAAREENKTTNVCEYMRTYELFSV